VVACLGHGLHTLPAVPSQLLLLLWPPCIADADIIFLPSGFFFFFYLFSSPNLSRRRLDVCHTSTHGVSGLSANLGCRSKPAAHCSLKIQNAKNRQKICHLDTMAQLCLAISSQLRHVSTIGKNSLNSNTSSICPRNMANFDPLMAEISSGVWGTPANFNGFRVLAALLLGTLVVGVSQTLQR